MHIIRSIEKKDGGYVAKCRTPTGRYNEVFCVKLDDLMTVVRAKILEHDAVEAEAVSKVDAVHGCSGDD